MIREPSLTNLPSSQRQSRLQEDGIEALGRRREITRLETVVIYPKPTRVPTVALRTLSVSSQWGQLYQMACGEVLRHVQGVDPVAVKLIFETNKAEVRNDIQDMEDVSTLVYTVYKVLYYEWFERNRTSHLAIIVHCVQAFMTDIVDAADFDSALNRRRLSKSCRDLKRSCEASKYQHLRSCLDQTRLVYIDLWCTLLSLLPFAENSQPGPNPSLSLSQVRERISLSREREIISE